MCISTWLAAVVQLALVNMAVRHYAKRVNRDSYSFFFSLLFQERTFKKLT